MKILIAEDDPVFRKVLDATLRQFGHELTIVTNGETALSAFDRDPYDVIVSDWIMPRIDGLQLCKQIRSRQDMREYVYFILLTAKNHTREEYRSAMQTGVDDFLAKPLDVEVMHMRLRVAERMLDFHRQLRELQSLIPICMYCKNVRKDKTYWQSVETYIREQMGASLSHGICPDCMETVIKPQVEKMQEKRRNRTVPASDGRT